MRNGANGHSNGTAGKPGIRGKRRHTRSILKEGVEAALRANPEVLEKCKPKTAYGRLVCGLVLEAAKCKATPLKTLMQLIDWEPDTDEEAGDTADEAHRDWSPDGVWETMPEPEPAGETVEEPEGEEAESPAKKELKRRLIRLVEAGQHEHAARILDAIRSGQYDRPAPAAAATG
ncbi:MAG TPA: hypothetical protein VKR31_00070 [Rhizomicrobium sp.]|nr:hypothetical protein [Rhizomicrobium sp.]